METLFRVAELDPLAQRTTYQMRVRLFHDGQIVKEEDYDLKINIYLVQEVLLMLHHAGFRDMAVEAGYTGRPRPGTTAWSPSWPPSRANQPPRRACEPG